MSDDEIIKKIEQEESIAYGINDSELSKQRAQSINYYLGEPFGNEVEGRSQVVSYDVQDTVESSLPQLIKIFTSGDQVVRFDPRNPDDEAAAEQETDYINHLVMEKNNGFEVMYCWFKDALISKNGYVKAYHEEEYEESTEVYEGLTDGQLQMLATGEDIEILEHSSYPDPSGNPAEMGGLQSMLHDVKIKVTEKKDCIKIKNVAPESIMVSIDTQGVGLSESRFVQHRETMEVSELKEQGFDVPDDIQFTDDDSYQIENNARDLYSETFDRVYDSDSKRILVRDTYIKINEKRWRYVVVGTTVIHKEEFDYVPFACVSPMLMPHRHIGRSYSDLTMDIQIIKSALIRGQLDNMYLSNNGRYAISDRVNLEDMLVSRPGGVVRVQGEPGAAILPLQHTAFPPTSFTMVEYMDTMKEKRTGVTSYNQGLDADSLNKMLDLDTPVPMADGTYKTMGTVVDGDFIIGSSGLPTEIVKAHPIDLPERAYRIKFLSGDEIVAGGEHLWRVMTQRNLRDGVDQVLNTDELASKPIKEGHAFHWNIPRVWGIEFNEKELPLDPYIFGLWLGDGAQHSARITTCDSEILDALTDWAIENNGSVIACNDEKAGKAETYRINGLHQILARMGVLRVKGRFPDAVKHIPKEYLEASYDQRLALLQGLMDTDGCAHSDGSMSIFSQSEGRLLSDTVLLIESLGGWPSVRELKTYESMYETTKKHYQVSFSLMDCPFRLTRKAVRHTPLQRCSKSQPIVSIEQVEVRPMRCITVAAKDGGYCVGRRFTLTHNTATGINAIMQAAAARLELVARVFAETGVKELFMLVHRLVRTNYTKPDIVRLRGKWVDIDPRSWKNRADMSIAVGLGTGNKDAQLMHLQTILAAQKEAIPLGVSTPKNIYNALIKLTQNAGFRNPEVFWTDPGDKPMPTPPPDPKIQATQMTLEADAQKFQAQAQVEKEKFEAEAQMDQMKFQAEATIEMQKAQQQAEQEEMRSRNDLLIEREKLQMQAELEKYKADLKAETDIKIAVIQAELQAQQMAQQAEQDAKNQQIEERRHQEQLQASTKAKTVVRGSDGKVSGIQ